MIIQQTVNAYAANYLFILDIVSRYGPTLRNVDHLRKE